MKTHLSWAILLIFGLSGCETYTPSSSNSGPTGWVSDTNRQVEAELQHSDIGSLSIAERKKIWKTIVGNWAGNGNAQYHFSGTRFEVFGSDIALTLSMSGNSIKLERYAETSRFISAGDLLSSFIFSYSPEEKGTIQNSISGSDSHKSGGGTFSLQNSAFTGEFTAVTFTGYAQYTIFGESLQAGQFFITLKLCGTSASGYKLVAYNQGSSIGKSLAVALNRTN